MQPNRILFFAIVSLSIIAVIGMLFVRSLLPGVNPEEISIQVVADPSIKPWLEQAAQTFNQKDPNQQVEVIEANDLIPEAQFISDGQTEAPIAWLAGGAFVLDMAKTNGLAFEEGRSVASTSLAWGVFQSRAAEFQNGLNWAALHEQANESNSTLKIIIASPGNSAEGLAALISATAAHVGTQTISNTDVSSAEQWLTETFKESTRNSRRLATPAADVATRGVSIIDAGMLTLASWHQAGLQNRSDFSITSPQFPVVLDYPFAIRAGTSSTAAGQTAQAFRDFLLLSEQQQALSQFFLEPAQTESVNSVQIDGQATLALQRWAERELR